VYCSTFLLPSHYAGKWLVPEEAHRYDLKEINLFGWEYAVLSDGAEKEARLLVIVEKFHGLLMKYLRMVISGTIPASNSHAGKDALEFLRQMGPRAGSDPRVPTARLSGRRSTSASSIGPASSKR
jgi:hypothetical protein